MGRIHSETDETFRKTFIGQFETVRQRFTTAFHRALPHLDAEEVTARMLFLVGSMAFTMSWCDRVIGLERLEERGPDELLEALIRFGAAGMAAPTAPVPARVSAKRRAQ